MKRGRKPFKARNHIAELNKFRIDLANETLPEDQFKNELKKCGVLSNRLFLIALKHSGIIEVQNGRFSFLNPQKPIHYSVLQDIYTAYISRQRDYLQKRRNKELTEAKLEEVQNAIELLKEYNFEVYAPVGMYFVEL